MSEVQCLRIRIQPGKTEQLFAFLKGLDDRPREVQEALAADGIIRESLFLDRTPQADYLILVVRAENLASANLAFLESGLQVDMETKRVISDTWAAVTPLELVVDLERLSGSFPRKKTCAARRFLHR
jgi:Family of unknown function (DUF6176)